MRTEAFVSGLAAVVERRARSSRGCVRSWLRQARVVVRLQPEPRLARFSMPSKSMTRSFGASFLSVSFSSFFSSGCVASWRSPPRRSPAETDSSRPCAAPARKYPSLAIQRVVELRLRNQRSELVHAEEVQVIAVRVPRRRVRAGSSASVTRCCLVVRAAPDRRPTGNPLRVGHAERKEICRAATTRNPGWRRAWIAPPRRSCCRPASPRYSPPSLSLNAIRFPSADHSGA